MALTVYFKKLVETLSLKGNGFGGSRIIKFTATSEILLT